MVKDLAAKRFLLVLLVGALVLVSVVFLPLAKALFLGAALAAAFWPLNLRLARKFGKKHGRKVGAALITFGVVVVILGPVIGLSAYLINEANNGIKFVSQTIRSEGVTGLIERLPDSLEKAAREIIDRIPGDVSDDKKKVGTDEKVEQQVQKQVAEQGGKAAVVLGAAVSATGSVLFFAAMMMIAFYFLLLEGERLVDWVDGVAPLPKGRVTELLGAVRKVSSSVLVSELVVASAQAVVALVGYLIARVPNPVFFAAVTFFIAFIPAVGAGSVCLAAAALLLVTGHPYMALFLAIWALSAVALIDNVIKPFLIKGDADMHGAIVFFALLGGLAAFGAVGLLIGPVAVALLLELIRMYRSDFGPERETGDRRKLST